MTKTPNNFDFIRLVAASMVIWGHAYPLLGEPGLPGIMGASIHTFAVKLFFAVSGYLVVGSWLADQNVPRFIAKRALRIMPALVVVVTLAALLLGPAVTTLPWNEYVANPLLSDYFKNILLDIRYALPGVFEDNIYPIAVNGSLWTLPVEVAMYVLVLVTGWCTHRFADAWFRPAWLALTLGFIALSTYQATSAPELLEGVVIYRVLISAALDLAPFFMIGGCLSIFAGLIPQSQVAAAALFLIGCFLDGSVFVVHAFNMIVVCYAVVVFGNSSTPVIRHTGRFGDLSYGVYLYGFPVAQTLSWAFAREIPFAAHVFWALALSFLFAFLSWHLVEKRALAFKPGRRKPRG